MDDKTLKLFETYGKTPPEHINHGIKLEELAERVKSVNPRNWRLEGNRLIADTDVGPLINYIPPNYILKGEKNNLPILEKVVL